MLVMLSLLLLIVVVAVFLAEQRTRFQVIDINSLANILVPFRYVSLFTLNQLPIFNSIELYA